MRSAGSVEREAKALPPHLMSWRPSRRTSVSSRSTICASDCSMAFRRCSMTSSRVSRGAVTSARRPLLNVPSPSTPTRRRSTLASEASDVGAAEKRPDAGAAPSCERHSDTHGSNTCAGDLVAVHARCIRHTLDTGISASPPDLHFAISRT